MLVREIVRDPYSHLCAAFNEWSYVPDPMDVFYLNWIDAQAQMHHRSGKVPPKPVRRPWEHGGDAKTSPPDPDSSDRREALKSRLGLTAVDASEIVNGEGHALSLPVERAVDDVDQPEPSGEQDEDQVPEPPHAGHAG